VTQTAGGCCIPFPRRSRHGSHGDEHTASSIKSAIGQDCISFIGCLPSRARRGVLPHRTLHGRHALSGRTKGWVVVPTVWRQTVNLGSKTLRR